MKEYLKTKTFSSEQETKKFWDLENFFLVTPSQEKNQIMNSQIFKKPNRISNPFKGLEENPGNDLRKVQSLSPRSFKQKLLEEEKKIECLLIKEKSREQEALNSIKQGKKIRNQNSVYSKRKNLKPEKSIKKEVKVLTHPQKSYSSFFLPLLDSGQVSGLKLNKKFIF